MAPAALPNDVVAEILIRLPHDDPSCLLRASLVCKPWLGIVSGPDFRRRLGAFHRTPPMLGLLRDYCCAHTPRFTATTASAFSLPAAGGPDDCLGTALDCRHGRVLFLASNELLIIWEPMTGDLRRVPTPAAFDYIYFMPNAALVCTASGCDHRACTGGPFQIVFVFSKSNGGPMIIESETVAELCVCSSETQAWDEELTTIYIDSIVTTKRSILVGRTLYFPFNLGYILEYDLCGRDLGSGVGIAGIKESTLSVWSRDASGHGDVVWEQSRVIDLDPLLPAADDMELLGFAEQANVIFLGTCNGIFTIKLNSELVSKVCEKGDSEMLLPFISFYTPGCEECSVIGITT
ncbi:hypothetical protein GQ55_3G358700 [Panicum hallii var. hallii]|uniref:F-box domain-containing protein n=1 Tax=Panicum hallii var. hallii TaxID=1504633 RepID=A0A2T7EG03_9POAL|nr:hypothetical protein GQ55_3G358700 [Panicum hallii var. hallii]